MVQSILIKDGLVVTGDKKQKIISNGYVRVEGNRIKEISKDEPKESAEIVLDAKGCVIIPGLITAHTHLYGILLRGANRVWWKMDEALTLEDAKASALSASADMLRNGSTFFADTYSGPNSIEGSLDAIAAGANEIGIRSMLAFEMTERNIPDEAERGLKESIRFIQALPEDSISQGMLSLHASFTVGDEIIKKTMVTADELDVPLTIHTSEGLVDLYHNLKKYGERTVERLARLGVLKRRTVLAHCVHVDDKEMDLIAKHKVSVAHNPMSNMLNAVGTAPVPDKKNKKI
ncbi:MAG: amidohydrolase family protein, partial [Candidatus Thorarchaeota archaeon]